MNRLLLTLLLSLWLATPAWAFQVVTGTYTGNATDNRNITIAPACQPQWVMVTKTDSNWDTVTTTSAHPADNSSLLTGNDHAQINVIQALNSDGFQVGTGTYVNASGANYAYTAICDNGQNDIATGTITGAAGSGSDNLNVTISPAFQPTFVITLSGTDGRYTIFRGSTAHSGDQSSAVLNGIASVTTDQIQQFNSDGFQVGTIINSNSRLWYYVALKGTGVETGHFTGNTTDNRDITVGFPPRMVLIKGNSNTETGVVRNDAFVGDLSSCGSEATVNDVNRIQSFSATGFQVGTHDCANQNTVEMYWFALRTTAASGGMKARKPVRF